MKTKIFPLRRLHLSLPGPGALKSIVSRLKKSLTALRRPGRRFHSPLEEKKHRTAMEIKKTRFHGPGPPL